MVMTSTTNSRNMALYLQYHLQTTLSQRSRHI
jgi:hypothetical protein